MTTRRVVITGLYLALASLFTSVMGSILHGIWHPLMWIAFGMGLYLGYRTDRVWNWTGENIDSSFYCAAALHLECDAVMGCACRCHEEWDG